MPAKGRVAEARAGSGRKWLKRLGNAPWSAPGPALVITITIFVPMSSRTFNGEKRGR